MGIINKITIIFFSVLMFIISIIGCFIIFGWITIDFLVKILGVVIITPSVGISLLVLLIVCIFLSIRGIFCDIDKKNKMKVKNGILLENSDGKLLITKETLENLISNVIKEFENVERASCCIDLDSETNSLIVNSILTVKQGTIIKELSNNLQQRIKETIKKSADLDIKEINISIKNIENKTN